MAPAQGLAAVGKHGSTIGLNETFFYGAEQPGCFGVDQLALDAAKTLLHLHDDIQAGQIRRVAKIFPNAALHIISGDCRRCDFFTHDRGEARIVQRIRFAEYVEVNAADTTSKTKNG